MHHGDARHLPFVPDHHVDVVVTSPPYWRKRDYGFEGQIGQEKTSEEYVTALSAAMAEWHKYTSRLRQHIQTDAQRCRNTFDDAQAWINFIAFNFAEIFLTQPCGRSQILLSPPSLNPCLFNLSPETRHSILLKKDYHSARKMSIRPFSPLTIALFGCIFISEIRRATPNRRRRHD